MKKKIVICAALVALFLPLLAAETKNNAPKKPTPFTIDLKKEILFWADRFADHALYMSVFSQSDNFTKKALTLQAQFKKFVTNVSKIQFVNHPKVIGSYKKLLTNLSSLQNDLSLVYSVGIKGSQVATPVLKHMKEEYERHLEIINGKKRSLKEEREFWTNHDKEVAQLKSLVKAKKLSVQDQAMFDKLAKLGLDDHEAKEDAYAAQILKGA